MNVLTPQQAFDLALQYQRTGQLRQAEAIFKRLLALEPKNAGLLGKLGLISHQSGAFETAADYMRRAIAIQPLEIAFHNNLGNILQDQGKFEEAEAAYRQATAIGPQFAQPFSNLGNALKSQGKFEEAEAAYRLALKLDPHFSEVYANLANFLYEQGEVNEAIELYRGAIDLPDHFVGLYDNYLATLQYWPPLTMSDLFEAHRTFDLRYARHLGGSCHPNPGRRSLNRPIRLGFVSPHFEFHPVGYFLVRLFENISRDHFEIVCYSDTLTEDAMTRRLRQCVVSWHSTREWSDDHLAQHIRESRIDILFDLAGHTPGNRLLVFARKPAPIQITWLDYVGTTGLSAIDYIIADLRQIPHEAEEFYSEEVLRLPDDYICFDPPADAPSVGPLPAIRNGFVTFASFNIFPKTTSPVVATWCRILQSVPNSRLILKNRGFDRPAAISRLRSEFAKHSIVSERIIFEGHSSHEQLLSKYNDVDIALDTFPYNGGLTTCEALWMGVPVITCPGKTFAGRHGIAHLTAAGLPEMIVDGVENYIQTAVALACDLGRLEVLRSTLRGRVAGSALCAGCEFARNFEEMLRGVWERFCVQT